MRQPINRRHFMKSAAAVAAGATMLPRDVFAQAAPGKKPLNVVIMIADDQRHETVAALGDDHIQTPNIDALANGGFSFLHAKCMGSQNGAVCVPARAMLNTGRSMFHVPDNMGKFTTLGGTLQAAGYKSFAAGKWHNGTPSFVRSFNGGGNIFFGGMTLDQYKVPIRDFDPAGVYPKAAVRTGNKFSSELYTDAIVDFLQAHGKEKPFICYLAFTSPHDPRTPPEPFKSLYTPAKMPLPTNWLPKHPFDNGDMNGRDELLAPMPRTEADTKKQLCDYYGMISAQDAQVGRVIKTLEDAGLRDNTLVIYTGDHGLAIGSHGLFGKQNIYDHSQRIPLIFNGPQIPKAANSDAFVYGFDIFPTICEILGVTPPDSVEGKSLAGIIAGREKQLRDSAFYAYDRLHAPSDGVHKDMRAIQRAVHDGRWKYHHYLVKGQKTTLLFDMKNDPFEIHDLSQDASAAKELPRLTALLKKFQDDLNDNQAGMSG
ncbi:MAG TPA: sulfatase-like hydrolase/transferase [Tepidisphaeraceae bacterium]|jgi:arylsulfatase A-like enzyme|nr:sulfatase-like hydrolase/transferase [Tepidisphaeraceae bacterium]